MVTIICSLYSSVEPDHNEITNHGAFCYGCERGRPAHPQVLEGSTLQLDHDMFLFLLFQICMFYQCVVMKYPVVQWNLENDP